MNYSDSKQKFIDEKKSKTKSIPNPSLLYFKNHDVTKQSVNIVSGSLKSVKDENGKVNKHKHFFKNKSVKKYSQTMEIVMTPQKDKFWKRFLNFTQYT